MKLLTATLNNLLRHLSDKPMSQKFTIARYTRENQHFEVLVKPEKALDYRNSKISGITEVLAAETIFSDANKGTRAPEAELKKAFGTVAAYGRMEHLDSTTRA